MKHFESFTLDTANECLWHAGVRISLPPKPFAVLRYLVENAGRLVPHDELLDALWPEVYVQPQVLRTYMLELRKLLADDPRNPRFIRSIPKRGYCFVAAISDSPVSADPANLAPESTASRSLCAPFVGRRRELADLSGAMDFAACGSRQVVFLTGEAGVGKSALLDIFRRQLEPAFAVALGQCIPGFAARQDHYPLADALRQLHNSHANPVVHRVLHPGNAGNPVAPGELCAAIEEISHDKPLALLLEDLQWADRSTLDVLSALARRHGDARFIIVATVAPHPDSAYHAIRELMHDLRIRRLGSEIAMPRLGKEDVADFLRLQLEQSCLPDGLLAWIYRQSEGNPRYALTFLDHLRAEGSLRQAGEPPQWEFLVPADLDQAAPIELARTIELEIVRLSDREQRVLEAAAIPPIAFPTWIVAAALDDDLTTIEDVCDSLTRRVWFLRRAGEEELPTGARSAFYAFTHALYREVLYRRQSPARRTLRHARIARTLCEMFRGREALVACDAAAHFEAANLWREAIAMLRIAVRRAVDLRAYGEVAELEARIARLRANLPSGELHTDGLSDGRLAAPIADCNSLQ